MKKHQAGDAIFAGLRPREAQVLLDTLTAGYQDSLRAAQAAYTPAEQQARSAVALDLIAITLRHRQRQLGPDLETEPEAGG